MGNQQSKKQEQTALPNLLSSFLLIAYGFVTWLTPNMDTFDSNGPKFMTFSMLNIAVFVVLWVLVRKKMGRDFLLQFFDTKIGLSYGILTIFTLISFTKAININESILHFSKMFTTFAGAWFMGILVSRDRKALVPVAVALSLLLILDSFQTFSGIHKLIDGKLKSMLLIKSSYSNKNILSSALFVKIPFALWLFYFQKNWTKYFGGVALFLGILAIFFMSSRAFYLGLLFIVIFLIVYAIVKYKKTSKKKHLYTIGTFVGMVVVGLAIFLFVQNTFYPKKGVRSFSTRVESIASTKNSSNQLRLTAWKCSATQMLPKDPLLGVGVGNWKLRFLEYENQYNTGYTYMYKNHNDFLEITVESGIFAGLAFIGIFVFAFWYLFIVVFKRKDEEHEKYFFLPALGLMAYAFDAFFNFPQDRPEIQSWFAMYVGIAAGLSLIFWNGDSPFQKMKFKGRAVLQIVLGIFTAVILLGATYILVINKKSLVYQRDVKEEINRGKLKSPSEKYMKGFPSIPDITILAEPIAVQKARFLINEKKYAEAREILQADHSNPYDGRREYFIANSFFTEKQYDSALYYAKECLKVKPYFYNPNTIVASIYERRGELDNSIALWRSYLKGVKYKVEPWRVPVVLLERQGKLKEAEQLIDSAIVYLPNAAKLKSLRARIKQKMVSEDKLKAYNAAKKLYSKKKYKEAIPLFTKFLKEVPEFMQAYNLRSVCYFRQNDYKKAIADINSYEKIAGKLPANMINIRGASYLNSGNKDKAKTDFKKAMEMGDKDGKSNYNKFFKKKDKPISFKVPTRK